MRVSIFVLILLSIPSVCRAGDKTQTIYRLACERTIYKVILENIKTIDPKALAKDAVNACDDLVKHVDKQNKWSHVDSLPSEQGCLAATISLARNIPTLEKKSGDLFNKYCLQYISN